MFKRKFKTNPTEITSYVNNLQRITLLRDKCHVKTEVELYNKDIESMQRVLLHLSKV